MGMCFNYQLWLERTSMDDHYNVILSDIFEPRQSLFPKQQNPIITKQGTKMMAQMARWGLIPSWAKEKSAGDRMFNARSETVDVKPSFKSSFQSKRCLVPATGFYEYEKLDSGKRRPCLFKLKTGDLFSFAGLWSEWCDPAVDEIVVSYTIITTMPNPLVAKVHDRMPVILPKSAEQEWLERPDKGLLKPIDESLMEMVCKV